MHKSYYKLGHLLINHWPQNRASILNKVLCSWLCPDNGDTWHDDITTCLNLTGTTISLISLTLAMRRVS